MHLNIEIKARTDKYLHIKEVLESHNALYKGLDHQIDTYYQVSGGRLKLRQGNIEKSLIFYERSDQEGPKASHVSLYHPQKDQDLKALLGRALGVWRIVDKKREIYFVDNVKIHLDRVEGLGSFVEIEAIDSDGSIGEEKLREQCNYFMEKFEILESDLLSNSYSDMVGEQP
ncbi:MAG: class IV adenylate cyclase [Bacteroidia bacterium]|nr:class IV adenylate cyclase [Bacteroidia bacterium]